MSAPPNTPIYLDSAATSQVDREVVAAVQRVIEAEFGNPSSQHPLGLAAQKRLRAARTVIAERAGVEPPQVVFTSGGTEALALALLGSAKLQRRPGHLLVSAIEHPAVLRNAELASSLGHTVEVVPVASSGWVDPDRVTAMLRETTFLVAIMHVNNETGIIQPVETIATAVHRRVPDCRVLVDAVQSFGLLDTRLDLLGADLLAASAHKIHGPKGSGCLVYRAGVKLAPLWGGGGQERGLRSGTENVPGIAGFGVAATTGRGDMTSLAAATARLTRAAIEAVPGAYLLGDDQRRAPHIAAVALPGARSDTLVNALAAAGVCVSSGSACHGPAMARQSHVLKAMRVPVSHGVIRISPSRLLTEEQIDHATELIGRVLKNTVSR